MATAPTFPQINGHVYSWASIEIRANGLPIVGVKSINYGDSLNPGKVYGTGPKAIGRTRGKYEAKADMEMYRKEFDILKLTLGIAGVGFGESSFDIVVQYFEPGQGVVADTIQRVRISAPDVSNSEGTDPSTVKVTLDPMDILWNGVPLVTPNKLGAI